jgi:hypothetical protein
MSLILDGTNGVSDIDGSAATPAIRGTDANTGIFFPAADTIAFSEGGTEAARFDANGRLGIGTASPNYKLEVSGNGTGVNSRIGVTNTGTSSTTEFGNDANGGFMATSGAFGNLFYTNGTERMRIDSSGNLLVGCTLIDVTADRVNGIVLNVSGANLGRIFTRGSGHSMGLDSSSGTQIQWWTDNGSTRIASGNITSSGSSTAYNTGSDYRLKENIAPMTGALAKVQALKPCTYKWKADGSDGQGFIAHELQEVVPDCVTGEKDAVETYIDEDGNEQTRIKPQGVDTSFLVATLTAAIQELKATVDAQAARIAALEAAV